MFTEVSENCTVYVKVTDQNNIAYEKNKAVNCFDTTKPTFNAAVNDGVLTVQASDTQSGVKAVYVNGYEYKDLTNGTLTVRLQSFDASYEYFSIKAMDNADNVSDTEKVNNPYYGKEDKASELPVSAQPTHPTTAQAAVTNHAMTDSSGNTTADTAMSIAKQKKQAMAEADKEEKEEKAQQSGMDSVVDAGNENKEPSMTGKEFYTIQTDTEKVFYLIVDRDGNEEKVYFLTEICENDLLNATSDNSETLPMNSMVTRWWIWLQSYLRSFVSFTDDGTHLVMQGDDYRIRIWDMNAGSFVCTMDGSGSVDHIVCDDESGLLAICQGYGLFLFETDGYGCVAYADNGMVYLKDNDSILLSNDRRTISRTYYKDYKTLKEEAHRQFPGASLSDEKKVKYNI